MCIRLLFILITKKKHITGQQWFLLLITCLWDSEEISSTNQDGELGSWNPIETIFLDHLPSILHSMLLADGSLWPKMPTKSQMEYPQLGFK
jgi:hypothetical protein